MRFGWSVDRSVRVGLCDRANEMRKQTTNVIIIRFMCNGHGERATKKKLHMENYKLKQKQQRNAK